ncbi:MAG: putative Ig domain-containing protein [Synergistaceae bacterium]|nr:putative Ig domain-containing protein [Synergistaceae bacterium]
MKGFRVMVLAVMLLAVCTAARADDVLINATNFPDAVFRSYVSSTFDTDSNGSLSEGEIAAATTIDVSKKGISRLKGIEYFTALTELNCSDNQLSALDISSNTALTTLSCEGNKMMAVDLSSNTALTKLTCNFLIESTDTAYVFDFKEFRTAYGVTGWNHRNSLDSILYCKDVSSRTGVSINNLNNDYIMSFPAYSTSEIDHIQFYCENGAEVNVYPVVNSSFAPMITTTDVADGTNGQSYSATLTAAGKTPMTWTIADGSLPGGLTLDSSTGTISGTISEAGAFTFTAQAKNSYGVSRKVLTLLVPFSSTREPSIVVEALPDAFVGSPYGVQLRSTGTSPVLWDLPTGSTLPDGLTLSTTGYLSGTPTTTGNPSFTVQAKNDEATTTATFTLKISASPTAARPSITTEIIDPATKDAPYTCQLMAYGTPPFEWTVKGKMPVGLSISSTGLITGSSGKTGIKKLTLTVSNDYGQETKKLSITTHILPSITTESLKDAVVNKKYSASIKKKSTKPSTWTLEGTLPQGITLFDADNAKITGIPPTNDKGMVRLTLSNPVGEVSRVYTLKVNAVPPKISPTKLPKGTYEKTYKAVIKTGSGTKPINLVLSGDLPAGMSFDASNSLIGGTPYEVCTELPLTLFASNLWGVVSRDYALTVKAVNPKITTKKLAEAVMGTAYSTDIEATGTPPITWTADGLPAGLTLSEAGRIDGTPTEYGKFSVKVSAKNDGKAANKTFKLTVLAAPSFGDETLAGGSQGKSYNATITANGSAPITYAVSGGALPSGLSLNNKGKLKGKPSEGGNFTFKVKATNSVDSAEKEFTLEITPSASNSGSLPGNAGTYYGEEKHEESAPADSVKKHTGSAPYADEVPALGGVETGGYVVVAELGTVSVDVSGMYDFSAELSADVEGELLWLARSSEPSEDDNIAEFFDEDGRDTDIVPESRKVNVSVWLRGGVTYKPAIAVKR